MPPRQERERALQRGRADLAAQAPGVAHVVGRAIRLQLVQHQHLLLVGGAGHARRALLGAKARARDGRLRGPGVDAPERQRQAGDGGRAEQLRRRHVLANYFAHAYHHLARLPRAGGE